MACLSKFTLRFMEQKEIDILTMAAERYGTSKAELLRALLRKLGKQMEGDIGETKLTELEKHFLNNYINIENKDISELKELDSKINKKNSINNKVVKEKDGENTGSTGNAASIAANIKKNM